MAAVKVGINGFGRIGRITFRAMAARPDEFDVVAVNDLSDPKALAMLVKYDSVQGRFPGTVEAEGSALIVNGKKITVCSERDPAKLPWGDMGVQVALESTGFFTKRAADGKPGYDSHLAAGAKKVVLSAPAKDKPDLTVVRGVNDHLLTPEHKCVSNASCTTNCLAPMCKVLHENFGIEHGLMTTVHAYTNDQRIADQIHSDPHRAGGGGEYHSDLHRGRAGRGTGPAGTQRQTHGDFLAGARARGQHHRPRGGPGERRVRRPDQPGHESRVRRAA